MAFPAALKKRLSAIETKRISRPLNVLLNTRGEDLTDTELDKVLRGVPLNRIPSDILLVYLNREYGTSYKSMDDLPDGTPAEWTDLV